MVLILISFAIPSEAQKIIIEKIQITGNNKTNENTIIKELCFKQLDSLEFEHFKLLLKKSEENLLKTSLFNYVTIEYVLNSNQVSLNINVEERWYVWIYPIFEHGSRNLSTFIRDKDLSRINYGGVLEFHNIKGENNFFRIKIRAGYRQQYSLSLFLQNIGKNKNHSFKTNSELFRQKVLISNIIQNKAVYESANKQNIFSNFNSYLGYSYRIDLSQNIGLGLAYKYYNISDIREIEYYEQAYNSFNFNYLMPILFYTFDQRNNKIYPCNGLYFNANFSYWKSLNQNYCSFVGINLEGQIHKQINSSRFAIHNTSSYKLYKETDSSYPFFQTQLEFGKDFWIRGYDYYYFLGNNSVKIQNTLSFLLMKRKIYNLPNFLPNEFKKIYTKIYLETFADFIYSDGYTERYNSINQLNKAYCFSYGLGISIETYYDRLLQINVSYIPNFKKIGIFVNYQTPIVKLF